MAYHFTSDHVDHGPPNISMQTVMEPEHLMPTSDEDTPGSPSTPGSSRRYLTNGPEGVKRAMSSPNVRSLGSDSGAMSPADKKRNKLGYHRTAVACGHCRRRKIRCIPALDDNSGRCSNCIRLKKDCQFFPVDQQIATVGRRGRSGSKVDTLAEGEMSASSSERGGPHVLGSSTEETLDTMDEQSLTPVSPEEVKYQQLNYSQSRGHEGFGQQVEQSGLNMFPASNPSTGYPHNNYFATSEANRLHGSYPATYGHPMFNSPLTTAPEQAFYSQHHPDAQEFGWPGQGADRPADVHERYSPYPPHRANSYPTLPPRRLSASQELPSNFPSSGHHFSAGAGYQQQMLNRQYPEPSQYTNMGWTPQSNARVPSLPVTSSTGFSQPWFATPLSYVREEDDPSNLGGSQGHTQHNFQPG